MVRTTIGESNLSGRSSRIARTAAPAVVAVFFSAACATGSADMIYHYPEPQAINNQSSASASSSTAPPPSLEGGVTRRTAGDIPEGTLVVAARTLSGLAVDGVSVRAHRFAPCGPEGPVEGAEQLSSHGGLTDTNGIFALTVPHGCYTVTLGDDAHQRYPVAVEAQSTLVTSATKTDAIEVLFYDGPKGLTEWAAGTILLKDEASGGPVSAANVTVEPCDKSAAPYTSPRSFADGRIVVALAPGCHTVKAGDSVTELHVDADTGFADVDIDVEKGQTP